MLPTAEMLNFFALVRKNVLETLTFLQFRAHFWPKRPKSLTFQRWEAKKKTSTAEMLNFFALVRKMCSKLQKC